MSEQSREKIHGPAPCPSAKNNPTRYLLQECPTPKTQTIQHPRRREFRKIASQVITPERRKAIFLVFSVRQRRERRVTKVTQSRLTNRGVTKRVTRSDEESEEE
jgi:hypothetical protein